MAEINLTDTILNLTVTYYRTSVMSWLMKDECMKIRTHCLNTMGSMKISEDLRTDLRCLIKVPVYCKPRIVAMKD